MNNKIIRRINKLNRLLTLSKEVWESTWKEDYEDPYCDFTDELRSIMSASTILQDKVMIEVEHLRKQL